MGALPKKRISTARQGKRRASKGYLMPNLTVCQNCKTPITAHTACPNCGTYKGRTVTTPKVKTKVTKSDNK
ncbi:50S ribosomal protein L32 [Patescibacteria group bacterium]|nr:50S ribosomal protein L32 [Patescibacteria group bacterium]